MVLVFGSLLAALALEAEIAVMLHVGAHSRSPSNPWTSVFAPKKGWGQIKKGRGQMKKVRGQMKTGMGPKKEGAK